MREIKFRQWCRSANKFFFASMATECLAQQNEYNDPQGSCLAFDHIGDGDFFEQFTGLHDKNGKDIFEGDIIRNHTDFNLDVHGEYVDYEVIFRNGCWMVSFYKSAKGQTLPKGYTCGAILEIFQSEDQSKEFYFSDHERYSTIDIEVTGNIHENPELLNEQGR